MLAQESPSFSVQKLLELLEKREFVYLRSHLNSLEAVDIGRFLENIPEKDRNLVWSLLNPKKRGQVLPFLDKEVSNKYIEGVDSEDLYFMLKNIEIDDLVDIFVQLPSKLTEELIEKLGAEGEKVKTLLAYKEDQAGSITNSNIIKIYDDVTIDILIRFIRKKQHSLPVSNEIFVIDRIDNYKGLVNFKDILLAKPSLEVGDIVQPPSIVFSATESLKHVASSFERYDLLTAPVVDSEGKLLGAITIDDVVDVIKGAAEESFQQMGGLGGNESLFSPLSASFINRNLWLGVNLITAILASIVVAFFAPVISREPYLASLMPIVASMGGIGTIQVATLIVRSLSNQSLNKKFYPRIFFREFSLGMGGGTLWGGILGLYVAVWFSRFDIAWMVWVAIFLNMLFASLLGAFLPILLDKLKIDPALASSVILTTFTDCFGFGLFLGLASFFL